MTLIAGVDSSTQSTKVEVRDASSGEIVATGSAPHPPVTAPVSEQDPESWWSAFEAAWAAAGSPAVDAISVGGQQHGMVAVDENGVAVHPAKLWNDTESSPDSDALIEQLGGAGMWAAAVGSVPVAAFTITKLAWLRRTRPEVWNTVAAVMLPHDYLNLTDREQRVVITADVTTRSEFGALTTSKATRFLTIKPGTASTDPGNPNLPGAGTGGNGSNPGTSPCGASGMIPLLGMAVVLLSMMLVRRRHGA